MNSLKPNHTSSLRNLRITAVDRPELRAVFVADDDGLTMRWISTPRTSGNHLAAAPELSPADGTCRRDAA